MNEDLRNWFREKWVRMDTKGNIKGNCAREEGEGKPKCLPLAKARSMDKADRAVAARRKRKEDPNPDRQGKPINVKTEACWDGYVARGMKKKGSKMVPNCLPEDMTEEDSTSELIKKSHSERGSPGTLKAKIKGPITLEKVRSLKNKPNATTLDKKQANFYINMHSEEYLEEKNAPTNPSLWSKAKSLARQKFDVYPSAYANGWAAKWYKSKGGGWKSLGEGMQMKTTKTPQEKFKSGLKKSGYDPDAGAKRLLDLIAKQKKEREEFEKKYKSAYEGREMKSLKQILEGVVVMSDFKLDKKGRKYKARRALMGRDDMTNEGRAEDAMGDLDKEIDKAKKPMDQANNMDSDLQKFRDRAKSGQSGNATKLKDMNPIDRAKFEKEFGVKEDTQIDELKKSTLRSYLKKAVPSHGDQEFISRVSRDPEEKAAAKRTASNRAVGIIRANRGLKSAHVATMKEDINPYHDLDEARGRPAGAATLAKRAAAAAKPRADDDEGEQYDADSGVEADQHIHVQLKKAVDSDQKPFQVSFKNGKKHTVSQKVAKDILGATDKLKPQDRKEVHDHIHQSYDNLVSVHRMVAGK